MGTDVSCCSSQKDVRNCWGSHFAMKQIAKEQTVIV